MAQVTDAGPGGLDPAGVAALRAAHARELARAQMEAKCASDAATEARVRHDAVARTLKQLQAEHRLLADDHERLSIVVDAQARVSAEQEAKTEFDLRLQLERALRPAQYGIGGPGSATARLREEILNAAQEIDAKAAAAARRPGSGRVELRLGGARAAAPAAAPPIPRPPSASRVARPPTDLAERLRALEGAAGADEMAALREDAAGLRRELERRERDAVARDGETGQQIAELKGALGAAEARRAAADVESQRQLLQLRQQVTALRQQVSDQRREATYGGTAVRQPFAADGALSPRAPGARGGGNGGGGGGGGATRRRFSAAVSEAELDGLADQISEKLVKHGIVPFAADDDDDDDENYLSEQFRALQARRALGHPALGHAMTSKPVPPRLGGPASHGGSGRELHARLTQLEPSHTALLQLKAKVTANANRARRPAPGPEALYRTAAVNDPAANSRRKTIATLRTRLEKVHRSGVAA